jgi:putative chitinase
MALTVDSLASAGCRREAAKAHLPHIIRAMQAADITTPARARHFLAQALFECGLLKYSEEIWGPTKWQKGYEGRADLGNTQPGDGFRFRGRGPFMLTGRSNYTRFGKLLGRPYATRPDLVGRPADGWLVAAHYWKDRKLNALADRGDARAITKGINGQATDGDPSHHLKRMQIYKALPEDCTPDPLHVLTRKERELVEALEAERRSAKRHGGWDALDPSHLQNASAIKAELRTCAAAVSHAAESEPNGWELNRRRERLKLINQTIAG